MDNKNPLSGQTANPLSDYFRQPGTYITLPSNGRFYKDKLTLSDSGELAIYPMTAKDELRLKNPDALFNEVLSKVQYLTLKTLTKYLLQMLI
jgi:hypothetical protein